jgi:hypothetical protein
MAFYVFFFILFSRADHVTPLYPQKLSLNFANKCRPLSRHSSLAE